MYNLTLSSLHYDSPNDFRNVGIETFPHMFYFFFPLKELPNFLSEDIEILSSHAAIDKRPQVCLHLDWESDNPDKNVAETRQLCSCQQTH